MCLVLLVSEILLFAVLISMATGAIFGASLEGGLLYPLRRRLMRYGRAEHLRSEWVQAEKELHKAMYSTDADVQKKEIHIEMCTKVRDNAKYSYLMYALWRKPLLLCLYCMPSIYGALLSPIAIVYGISIIAIPFAIFASSLMNKVMVLTIFKDQQ